MEKFTNKLGRRRRSMLHFARQYVDEMGFSVIPIEPRGKRPAIASWKEFQERRPTDEELVEWFNDTENNLGIVTGRLSKLAVVDLDSEEAVVFANENGFPDTPTVKGGQGTFLRN